MQRRHWRFCFPMQRDSRRESAVAQAHHRSDGVLFGPLFCGIHIMKLRELMVELEKSADSNPEVRFESVTYQGGGKTSKDAGFVDAKLNDGTVTIRVAVPPYDVENVRDCENDI